MKSVLIESCSLIRACSVLVFLWSLGCNPGADRNYDPEISENEAKIYQLHSDYVEGWKSMNEEKVMSLLEEGARIQPNRISPIEGKEKIRVFWFPADGSKTKIHHYSTDLIHLKILDTIAVTTHQSHLTWSYQKDSTQFSMVQQGINTTIYRKQKNNSWKIWRSMWTDLYSERI